MSREFNPLVSKLDIAAGDKLLRPNGFLVAVDLIFLFAEMAFFEVQFSNIAKKNDLIKKSKPSFIINVWMGLPAIIEITISDTNQAP